MNMERSGITTWTPTEPRASASGAFDLPIEDIWIEERLNACAETVDAALRVHRYHEAAQALWDFVWKEFCDWYLEVKKLRFDSYALSVYERMLRLLHPFMPFLTEELWQRLMLTTSAGHSKSISLAPYPKPDAAPPDNTKPEEFRNIQRIVTRAREMRADNKVDPKLEIESTLQLRDRLLSDTDVYLIENLARLKIKQELLDDASENALPFTLLLSLQAQPNGASRARLLKEIARLEKVIESQTRQLNDETFVAKAPPHVIESMRAKLAEYQAQLKKNRELLDNP